MSNDPQEPRRPLGGRDQSEKKQPFGARSGARRPDEERTPASPTDPYPWAKDDEQEEPAPAPDPDRLAPTTPYPWASDAPPKPPEPPPDPNKVAPTTPYPWASEAAPKKPERPPDPNKVAPTEPYPWASETEARRKPPPTPRQGTSPTAPYPWAEPEPEKPAGSPAPPPDPKPAESGRVNPTAPYAWASEKPAPNAPPGAANSDSRRVSPTAPYPWSDEAPLEPDDDFPVPAPQPSALADEPDPRNMSWADLIAGVDGTDAAPEEADLLDEAPLEPRLPGEALHAERPHISDAARSLPTEKEAPLERVTDRFLKRGSFFNRSNAIPSRSYLETENVPPPEPITLQVMPFLRTLGVILATSLLVATLFTWWTPNSFLPSISAGQLAIAEATQGGGAVSGAPQPTAGPSSSIGIVSGHRGINPSSGLPDPGAVCADGLTEESINATIAVKSAQLLEAAGYHVDIFDEFDPRLQGYRALAMVSIHVDSCEYVNDLATGFKVASFQASTQPDRDTRLVNCMVEQYANRTGMTLHPGVTFDMTDYHNFREIDPQTPGIIIEVGFLYLDRSFLTSRPDDSARGIVDGLLCYLHGQPSSVSTQPGTVIVSTPTEGVTPTPTITLTPTDFGALFETATQVETQVPLDQLTPAP